MNFDVAHESSSAVLWALTWWTLSVVVMMKLQNNAELLCFILLFRLLMIMKPVRIVFQLQFFLLTPQRPSSMKMNSVAICHERASFRFIFSLLLLVLCVLFHILSFTSSFELRFCLLLLLLHSFIIFYSSFTFHCCLLSSQISSTSSSEFSALTFNERWLLLWIMITRRLHCCILFNFILIYIALINSKNTWF